MLTYWQTEIMEEQAAMNQWEDMHEEDPNEAAYQDSIKMLDHALDELDSVINNLQEAADAVSGLTAQSKLDSYKYDIEKLAAGLGGLYRGLQLGFES